MKKVREGYKMTELGEIPEEWNIVSIKELFEFKNGLNKEKEYFGKGTKIINYTDVYKNRGLTDSIINGLVEVNEKEISQFSCKKGDVFFTRTSETIDEIGMSAVLLDDIKDLVFSGFILRARPKNNLLDLNFKKYCFSSYYVRKEITRKSSYTTRALTSGTLLNDVRIFIPTKEEQKKIASILSTVDEQIDNVERLIQKNKELKKGLMQQLLTKGIGHTKFKKTEIGEIPEEWEVRKILEISDTTSGGTPSRSKKEYYENGIYPWVKTGELYNKYIRETEEYITEEALNKSSAKLVPVNTVIIAMYGATIGKLSIAKSEVSTNQACCSIICNENICYNEYLYYRLNFERESIINLGAGGAQPNISQDIIKNYKISIPRIDEQKKIALILSEVDEKIGEYENKKQKLEELKKGLMQQLLTGKIRV